MASSTPETTCPARARCVSSTMRFSSSSALARTTPSWLFSRWNSRSNSGPELTTNLRSLAKSVGRPGVVVSLRVSEKRVGKNPDRTASGSDVLNFAVGNPIVDCPAADADQLACARDRDCLAVQHDRAPHDGSPPTIGLRTDGLYGKLASSRASEPAGGI